MIFPSRLDFVVSEERLYWTDIQLNEIKTSGLINGPIETILDKDILNPTGFSIDWISKTMFIAIGDINYRIIACNLKGEYLTEIINGLEPVFSLIVNPIK